LLGKFQSNRDKNAMFADYPLVIYDDLPINSMMIFHGYVTNNQMVNLNSCWFNRHVCLLNCHQITREISPAVTEKIRAPSQSHLLATCGRTRQTCRA